MLLRYSSSLTNSSYSTTGVQYQKLFGNDDNRNTSTDDSRSTPNSGGSSLTSASAGSNQSGGSEDVD